MSLITFGTDGWRSIIAENFTFDNVRLVTQAIADYVKVNYPEKSPVVIGYDTRFLSPEFAKCVAEVLNNNGIDVLIPKRDIPTPVAAFAALNWQSAGAIMITASHNPPIYSGIKYIPDYAGPATPEITNKIVENVLSLEKNGIKIDETIKKGIIKEFDPTKKYFDFIKGRLELEKLSQCNLKIVYDAMYSTGRGFLDEILSSITTCEIHTLHNYRDVLFGGSMPEPNVQYLNEMKEFILKNNYQLGLATDGDADRFGIMDEKGKFYTPNQVISLLLRHLVKNRGFNGTVVRTIATTHLLDRLADYYELDLIETPVGFKYIGAVMRERDVVIGGEESGGLSILGHIPEKDGILANLLVVEMLAFENKPLSEIWKEMVNELEFEPSNKRLDLHFTQADKEAVMDLFRTNTPSKIGEHKVVKVKTIDGVQLILDDDSWVLVRPSGTEPIVRVYLETNGPKHLVQLQYDIEELINTAKMS